MAIVLVSSFPPSRGVSRREVAKTFPDASTTPPSTLVPPTSTPTVNDIYEFNLLNVISIVAKLDQWLLARLFCASWPESALKSRHLTHM